MIVKLLLWPILRKYIPATVFLLFLALIASAQEIDFSRIPSPIIFEGNYKYAYRDPAALYHDGAIHLFFTLVERSADGGMYLFTAYSKSTDLVHWRFPRILTPKDRNLNYSSPGNVVRFHDEWIMCLQTYPTPNKETWGNSSSRLWIMRSNDLASWSEPELLRVKGPDVPREQMGRMIDPYLLEDIDEPGKWWCYFKQNGVSMSYSYDLTNWTYAGRADSGENVTVLIKDGEYVLFHSPENGVGTKRSSRPDQWGSDEKLLFLGQDEWPWAKRRLTAATVIDLTGVEEIEKYLMFFHGASEEGAKPHYNAHNNASLGIAWSDDLERWEWPGQ